MDPVMPENVTSETWQRLVIAVDPAVSSTGDACGIVAVGLADGTTSVLFSVSRQRPVTGTVVVPSVTSPVGVVTCTVMVLPVVTDEVPVTFVDGRQHDFFRVEPGRLRAALS